MDFVIQQIPIPKSERNLVKGIANDMDIKLYELMDHILLWFSDYVQQNPNPPIFASPKTDSTYWSFAVYQPRVALIQELATKLNASNNRVLYTAIKTWLQVNHTNQTAL